MTGQLKMSCISSYSGHFSYLYFLIVRTQRFFRSFGQSVCLSTMLSFFVEHVSKQTYQRNRSVSPVSAIVSVAYARASSIDACQTLINSRFNERRTDANRGDILSSHDKNQIHVHNHARVHTVSYVSVIIEPFWSFCVINMPKCLFFESLDPSMMKPYRLVFITNVVSEGSGEPVLLCNLVG